MDGASRRRMAPAGGGESSRAELDPDPLPLRPRGAAELVDASVELLRGRFPIYFGLAALILLPVRVAGYYSSHAWAQLEELGTLAVLQFVVFSFVLPALVPALVTALVIVIVHGQLLGRRVAPGSAVRVALRRLPALIGLLFLMGLVLGVGIGSAVLLAVLCFPLLPLALAASLWLYWKVYLATPALMLEGIGPVAAVRRSFELTPGSFLRWLGMFMLASILTLLVSALAQIGDDPFVRDDMILDATGLSVGAFTLLYLPISTILTAIPTAFMGVVATAFYLDARMRREAFDLVLRLERSAPAGA